MSAVLASIGVIHRDSHNELFGDGYETWYSRQMPDTQLCSDCGSMWNGSDNSICPECGVRDTFMWPKDRENWLKVGRDRQIIKSWRCTRCLEFFSLAIDPANVPIPWWTEEANKSFSAENPCPWACPECGNYHETVPTLGN